MPVWLWILVIVLGLYISWLMLRSYFSDAVLVWVAYQWLRLRFFRRSRNNLRRVRHPENLGPVYQAWYHFVQGACSQQARDFPAAEQAYKLCLDLKSMPPENQSLIYFALAQIAFQKNKPDEAKSLLQQAMQLPHPVAMQSRYLQAWNACAAASSHPLEPHC